MRSALFALTGIAALTAGALAANAAPAVPASAAEHGANIIAVAGGCGPGFHPTPWGHCVPFRHGFYRPRYYGGGPSDYMADELNARELGRFNRGY